MRPVRALNGSFNFMGGRVPVVVGWLVGLTLGASILGAVGLRSGLPLVLAAGLSPEAVFRGEVWRLVTWIFFEMEPVSLIFACLMLWWFGRDLSYAWGPTRFLAVYLGFGIVTAVATCLIALVWPEVMRGFYVTTWPLAEAMVLAWAVLFPSRQILVYFLFPLGGRNLIYLTVGGTVLFALFYGFARFVPHFIAAALMLAYVREPSLYRLWLRMRLATISRGSGRRASHLRPVDKDDWGKPPRWLH